MQKIETCCSLPFIDLATMIEKVFGHALTKRILICSIKSVRVSTGRRLSARHCVGFNRELVCETGLLEVRPASERISITCRGSDTKGAEPGDVIESQETRPPVVVCGVSSSAAVNYQLLISVPTSADNGERVIVRAGRARK